MKQDTYVCRRGRKQGFPARVAGASPSRPRYDLKSRSKKSLSTTNTYTRTSNLINMSNDSESVQPGLQSSNMEQEPPANDLPVVLATFTIFERFPPELRNKIWKEACSVRRNIFIAAKRVGHLEAEDNRTFSPFYYVTRSPWFPAILHASHEARTEALRYYKLDFGVDIKNSPWQFSAPARTYVNWQVDRIYINDFEAFDLTSTSLNPLQHFFQLCKERALKKIALNVADYSVVHLLYVLSSGYISIPEIILFKAHRNVITREVEEKDRATLSFYAITQASIKAAQGDKDFYSNKGEVVWAGSRPRISDLENTQKTLVTGFERFEKRQNTMYMGPSYQKKIPLKQWIRPNIKFCAVGLKLKPRKEVGSELLVGPGAEGNTS